MDIARRSLVEGHRLTLPDKLVVDTAESVAFLREAITEQSPSFDSINGSYRLMDPVTSSDLENLVEITLKEMHPLENYRGRFLHVVNIEPARGYQFEESWSDEIHFPLSAALLVQDNNKAVTRCFVYNYVWPRLSNELDSNDGREDAYGYSPIADKSQRLGRKLPLGCHLDIINPKIMIAKDGIPTITVYDNLLVTPRKDGDAKICGNCGTVGMEFSHCAKCQQTFYCSRDCQLTDWMENLGHRIVCKTIQKTEENDEVVFKLKGSLTLPWSVYVFAYLVHEDYLPVHSMIDVRFDYGFANCEELPESVIVNHEFPYRDEVMLFGLYIGLIKDIRCDLVKLHIASMSDQLAEFIKHNYETKSDGSDYYSWFLNNQAIVKHKRLGITKHGQGEEIHGTTSPTGKARVGSSTTQRKKNTNAFVSKQKGTQQKKPTRNRAEPAQKFSETADDGIVEDKNKSGNTEDAENRSGKLSLAFSTSGVIGNAGESTPIYGSDKNEIPGIEEKSERKLYCLSLAARMGNFNPQQFAIAKMEIEKALFKIEFP